MLKKNVGKVKYFSFSLGVETFGTGRRADGEILDTVKRHFDLTAAGMISRLNLRRPIYRPAAAYGHFGRPSEGVHFPLEVVVPLY
jgi:S-adenosylmethionine synthetase